MQVFEIRSKDLIGNSATFTGTSGALQSSQSFPAAAILAQSPQGTQPLLESCQICIERGSPGQYSTLGVSIPCGFSLC